jgi:cytochrome b6-f complex iron-sulfur subunit
MADQSSKSVVNGVLGHLPPWPREALNNSVIGMEQAYRQRKGLPPLSDEDIAALKAGEPMPWDRGEGAPAVPASTAAPVAPEAPTAPLAQAPPATTAAPAAAPPAAATAPVAAGAPKGGISPEVAKLIAEGKKWSRSAIAAEQARRNRKGLPALTDAEVNALLGEEAAAATAPAPAEARPAASAPAPAVAATGAGQKVAPAVSQTPAARGTEANKYIGTPAVGTSKAAAAGGIASVGPENREVDQRRRRLVWSCVTAFLGAWFIAFFRFFLPRTLFEPSTVFKIGYPSDYGLGVDTKWQQKYRIWVDRTPDRLFVIYARCTHLGCTPDWKASENKFKCPCHGSGYDSEGVNFEGPAPRPMDRAHIEPAPDGQIVVDVSRLYQWPKGQPSHFNDPGAFLNV